MSIRITRPRFKRALNDARCELAEARARAARSLARLHEEDGTWLGWLATEHYKTALLKWTEYLRSSGEDRKILRYEFLTNLKIWLELLPLPLHSEIDSYRQGNVYIAGFFGEDAFVVSHVRGGKRYRLLCDDQRRRRNDPYLRYPGSERFILPDGDDVGILETSNTTRDRLVCLHDAFVLVAITRGTSFNFRFVGANDKYPVFPKALEKDLSSFIGMKELIERIKREISAYGGGTDENERIDEVLCGPPASELYQPKKGRETKTLHSLNQSILDTVDPTAEVPSISGPRKPVEMVADTVGVGAAARESKEDTGRIVAKRKEALGALEERTTMKQASAAKSDSEGRSRHGTQRVTSRKVITNAYMKRDLEARAEEHEGLAPQSKKVRKGITAFFEGILDDVDPLSVRPSLRKKQSGKTQEYLEQDQLAGEFMLAATGAPKAEPNVDTASNRVISNFSRKMTHSEAGGKRTHRPSGDVTTELVRSAVSRRNDSERRSALMKLQEDLDNFFDPRDANERSISTSLRTRESTTEILRLKAFRVE